MPNPNYPITYLKNFQSNRSFKNDKKLINSRLEIQNACIGTEEPTEGKVTVSGWGLLGGGSQLSDQLMAADMKIMTRQKCVAAYPFFSKNMICAKDESASIISGACKGDSGGQIIQSTDCECIFFEAFKKITYIYI